MIASRARTDVEYWIVLNNIIQVTVPDKTAMKNAFADFDFSTHRFTRFVSISNGQIIAKGITLLEIHQGGKSYDLPSSVEDFKGWLKNGFPDGATNFMVPKYLSEHSICHCKCFNRAN